MPRAFRPVLRRRPRFRRVWPRAVRFPWRLLPECECRRRGCCPMGIGSCRCCRECVDRERCDCPGTTLLVVIEAFAGSVETPAEGVGLHALLGSCLLPVLALVTLTRHPTGRNDSAWLHCLSMQEHTGANGDALVAPATRVLWLYSFPVALPSPCRNLFGDRELARVPCQEIRRHSLLPAPRLRRQWPYAFSTAPRNSFSRSLISLRRSARNFL